MRTRRENTIMRWESRYSSAEMIYLEVTDQDVRTYLNDGVRYAEHWTFEAILSGKADSQLRPLFGDEVLEKLKAAVQARVGVEPTP